MASRFKLFSDPVHGFVSVPKGLPLDLIETPEFQRLRRIRQLGLGHLVFPGAEHTRLAHALGAMALMQQALATIAEKGTPVSPAETEAALAVALLHDIGHGPFSHTLEADLLPPGPDCRPFHHEAMSRALARRINGRLGGRLDLALAMFDGSYERPFFHALMASQLDMDRLDYLRRDSFYTGVAEGVVGVERILKTLRVHPEAGGPGSQVVIEAKGTYAVENYILSRRLMYWQVYLHKSVIGGDHLLRAAFARARARWGSGDPALECTAPALAFFLDGRATVADLADERGPAYAPLLDAFTALDDPAVFYSLSRWADSPDRILADLARRFLDRDLFRTTYLPEPPDAATLDAWHARVADWLVRSGRSAPADALADAPYYLAVGRSRLDAYRPTGDAICILERDGRVRELSEASDVAAIGAVSGAVVKPYVCAPRQVALVVETWGLNPPLEPAAARHE